jgi:serine/threonine protein kinase
MCGGILPPKAPEGLCPRCLLVGVASPTETESGQPARRQPPPSCEAIEAAFPQLEILELFGQGGMGAVFKARQPKLNRLVALKILPESLGRDPRFAERFAREGQLLARLNHPNIVTVHDFGQTGNHFYLLMEFVDGVNLRQAMRAGRFTAAQALGIVPKICEALQYAHDEGVLHRDIKPENILLDTKGRVKLADFGIAKFIGDVEAAELEPSSADASPAPQLTSASAALGTPNYMAPEQREHPADVDHRADIYSLGVVFYEMLTGELPLGKFAAPSEKTPLDPRVDEVVLRALEQKRERRQQSAGEIKTQVETIATSSGGGRSEPAQPSGLPPRFLKVCTSTLATPDQLATASGQFFHYHTRGQLILDDRQLTHSRAGTNTVIPLAAIRDLSIGQYPCTMNPACLDLISVTYEESGQRKQVLLSPMEGFFGFPATWNARVAEWFHAIRDAIISATGRAPGNTPAGRLGVPPGSKMIYAMFLLPVVLGIALITLLWVLAPARIGGSGSLMKTPFAQLLIIFVLGSGALAALGGNWLLRRKRNAAHPRSVAPIPEARKFPSNAFLLVALLLFSFAIIVAVLWLFHYESALAPPVPAGVGQQRGKQEAPNPPNMPPPAPTTQGPVTYTIPYADANFGTRVDGQPVGFLRLEGCGAHQNVALAPSVSLAGHPLHEIIAHFSGPEISPESWARRGGGITGPMLAPSPYEIMGQGWGGEASSARFICPNNCQLQFALEDDAEAAEASRQIKAALSRDVPLIIGNRVPLFRVGKREAWLEVRPFRSVPGKLAIFSGPNGRSGLSPLAAKITNGLDSAVISIPPNSELTLTGLLYDGNSSSTSLFTTTLTSPANQPGLYWLTWLASETGQSRLNRGPSGQRPKTSMETGWQIHIHDGLTTGELRRFDSPKTLDFAWLTHWTSESNSVPPGTEHMETLLTDANQVGLNSVPQVMVEVTMKPILPKRESK